MAVCESDAIANILNTILSTTQPLKEDSMVVRAEHFDNNEEQHEEKKRRGRPPTKKPHEAAPTEPKPHHEPEPAHAAEQHPHEHAPEHAPEHHEEKEEEVTKLQMQKGTDEVNIGGESYKVALGAAQPEGFVEVPPALAEILIKQGGAVEIVDPPQHHHREPMQQGFVHVRHATDPNASFTFQGIEYCPGDDGVIKAPTVAVVHIEAHGFKPC